jgi:hypothetical protein
LNQCDPSYAGTTSLFFTVGNLLKAGPWLVLAAPTKSLWMLMALCAPAVPASVWAGWRLHERLDQRALYRACYAILVVTAAKLLWDGLAGYVRAVVGQFDCGKSIGWNVDRQQRIFVGCQQKRPNAPRPQPARQVDHRHCDGREA